MSEVQMAAQQPQDVAGAEEDPEAIIDQLMQEPLPLVRNQSRLAQSQLRSQLYRNERVLIQAKKAFKVVLRLILLALVIVAYFYVKDMELKHQADLNRQKMTLDMISYVVLLPIVVSFILFSPFLVQVLVFRSTGKKMTSDETLILAICIAMASFPFLAYQSCGYMARLWTLNDDLTQAEQTRPTESSFLVLAFWFVAFLFIFCFIMTVFLVMFSYVLFPLMVHDQIKKRQREREEQAAEEQNRVSREERRAAQAQRRAEQDQRMALYQQQRMAQRPPDQRVTAAVERARAVAERIQVQNLQSGRGNYQGGMNPSAPPLRGNTLEQLKDFARNLMLSPETECVICCFEFQEDDEVVTLPCGATHIFHYECLETWFEQPNFMPTCPYCRVRFNP